LSCSTQIGSAEDIAVGREVDKERCVVIKGCDDLDSRGRVGSECGGPGTGDGDLSNARGAVRVREGDCGCRASCSCGDTSAGREDGTTAVDVAGGRRGNGDGDGESKVDSSDVLSNDDRDGGAVVGGGGGRSDRRGGADTVASGDNRSNVVSTGISDCSFDNVIIDGVENGDRDSREVEFSVILGSGTVAITPDVSADVVGKGGKELGCTIDVNSSLCKEDEGSDASKVHSGHGGEGGEGDDVLLGRTDGSGETGRGRAGSVASCLVEGEIVEGVDISLDGEGQGVGSVVGKVKSSKTAEGDVGTVVATVKSEGGLAVGSTLASKEPVSGEDLRRNEDTSGSGKSKETHVTLSSKHRSGHTGGDDVGEGRSDVELKTVAGSEIIDDDLFSGVGKRGHEEDAEDPLKQLHGWHFFSVSREREKG